MPIHQSGNNKGRLIQSQLQVEGLFRRGDPHPDYPEHLVFSCYKNGQQRWITPDALKERKTIAAKNSKNHYYSKVTDDKLTARGQLMRELKRQGISRLPVEQFKASLDHINQERGVEADQIQNNQYEVVNTSSVDYLLEEAERVKKNNQFQRLRVAAIQKAEEDLAAEIGSDNWKDLVKAGLSERTEAAEAEFMQSYNRLQLGQ